MRGGFLFFLLGNPRVFPRISRQVMGHQHWSQYELLWIHLGLYWCTFSLISSREEPWGGLGLCWLDGCQAGWLFTGKVEKDVVPGLKQGRGHSQWEGDRDLTGLWPHRRKTSQRDTSQEGERRHCFRRLPHHQGAGTPGFSAAELHPTRQILTRRLVHPPHLMGQPHFLNVPLKTTPGSWENLNRRAFSLHCGSAPGKVFLPIYKFRQYPLPLRWSFLSHRVQLKTQHCRYCLKWKPWPKRNKRRYKLGFRHFMVCFLFCYVLSYDF